MVDVKISTVRDKTYVTVKIGEKEYNFYHDDQGIHVSSWPSGVRVVMTDILHTPGHWVILK